MQQMIIWGRPVVVGLVNRKGELGSVLPRERRQGRSHVCERAELPLISFGLLMSAFVNSLEACKICHLRKPLGTRVS